MFKLFYIMRIISKTSYSKTYRVCKYCKHLIVHFFIETSSVNKAEVSLWYTRKYLVECRCINKSDNDIEQPFHVDKNQFFSEIVKASFAETTFLNKSS